MREFTDMQSEMLDEMRSFAREHFSRDAIRRWKGEHGLPDEVVQAFASLKYNPIALMESYSDELSFNTTLVIEELTRAAGATLPFETDIHSLHIMKELVPPDLAQSILDEYRERGRIAFSFAVTEPRAGSDSKSLQTEVRTEGDRLILRGCKTFVTNGEYAPFIFLTARNGDLCVKGERPVVSFWLVPNMLPGISALPLPQKVRGMLPLSEIVFKDVELDPSYEIKCEGDPLRQMYRLFESGRVLVCASLLGLAQAAMDDALAYAHSREAFGSKLVDFQLIEEKLVEMEIKLRSMRSFVYRAARRVDEKHPDASLDVALMKYYVPRTAVEVASDAVQILGGRGFTDDERVFDIWADCRSGQITHGTDEVMVRIATPMLSRKYGQA